MEEETHFHCLILGGGISGLDAAYHLQQYCPWADYRILERRDNLGGTWDFFKYPGLRSDSDMYTFGFYWKHWQSAKPIAPAADILDYLKEAAEEQGITKHIIFNTDIQTANWLSSDNKWHLTTTKGAKYSCSVLLGCTGYYSYESPHEPTFPGQEHFLGKIVHPQNWTEDDDALIVGKKVALIGSGATAVTILPSITDIAEHVTLIQRTPSYIAAAPSVDTWAQWINTWLPSSIAVRVNRWKAVLLGALFYQYCVRYPENAKKWIMAGMYKQVRSVMSKEQFKRHFTPPYNPWQQRFCLAPGGDFFAPIREGKATVVTGNIQQFTEHGIKMTDGEFVEAEFVISATGLTLQQNFPFSTIKVTIDGVEYKATDHMLYKSIMINDVPNFGCVLGYTNASWTLKADIACLYITKLLNYMRSHDMVKVVPKDDPDSGVVREVFTGGLSSGYFQRAGAVLPKQGDRNPWRGGANYILDLINLYFKGFNKDCLEFQSEDKKHN